MTSATPSAAEAVDVSCDDDGWTDEHPEFQSYRHDVREALQEIWSDS